jgi:hypothetical protein
MFKLIGLAMLVVGIVMLHGWACVIAIVGGICLLIKG